MGAQACRALPSGPEWATPRRFFEAMQRRFGPFDLDPAATPENAKAPRFYTRDTDGLRQPWPGRVWCNPPYGRGGVVGSWVQKAHAEVAAGRAEVVVALVPASTDTAWWHDHAMEAAEIHFVRTRLNFNDGTTRGTFPSAVIVFRRGYAGLPSFHAMTRDGEAPTAQENGAGGARDGR